MEFYTTWAVKGITIISGSMGGRGLGHADGWVRYDQPAGMHPMQHAEVMFVAKDIDGAFQPRSFLFFLPFAGFFAELRFERAMLPAARPAA